MSDDSLDETMGEEAVGEDTIDADEWEPVPTRQERAGDDSPDSEDQSAPKTGPTKPPRTGTPRTAATGGTRGTSQPKSSSTGSRKSVTSPVSAPYVPGADVVESRLPAGSMLGGRFEVLRQLGKGGMGEVFLVRDHQIEQREVALKLVRSKWSQNAKFRELFFQEIRSAQKFVSPHVVQVRDCGQLPDGQLFLTMDYVAGESLAQLLRREKNLSTKHALEVTRQLLLGLSSGHEHGFIHRDVKPGNLMLSARVLKTSDNPFGVKAGLLDFGLAALSEELEAERGPGTPHYMSPEQAMGQRLDARSDLFAVGIVLYEMLAGKRPFSGRTQKEVITSVIETDPSALIDNLEGVKKPVKKLLRKALQKEREKRYSSAADFLTALERVGPLQTEEGAPKAMTAIAAVASIAAVGLGGLFFNERISKKTADESIKSDRNQLASFENDLRAQAAKLAQANDTIQRLKTEIGTAAETAAAPLQVVIGEKDQAIGKLQSDLESANDKLRIMGNDKAALQGRLETDEVAEGLRKVDYNSLKIGAFQQIDDLLELIPRANDLQGIELASYGQLFDRMTKQVIESPQPDSSICRNKQSTRPPGMLEVPELGYLVQVEALGNEVGRLAGNPEAASTKDLEAARRKLSELGSPLAIENFKLNTSSTVPDSADTGRWLGIKQLTLSELDQRFWDRIEARIDEYKEEVVAEAPDAVKEGIQNSIPDEDARARKFLALMREYGGTEGLNKVLLDFHKDQALEVQRIEALTTVFAKLTERLDQVQSAIDAQAASIAAEALAEKNLSVQANLIKKFATQVGSVDAPEIPGLLASCAKACRAAATSGGDLNMSALKALPFSVDQLVDLLGERGLDESNSASAAPLIDLQWFVFAKRWYGSAVGTDLGDNPHPWMERFAERLSAAPTASHGEGTWKELLAFQVQLAKICVGPPQAENATATYVVQPKARPNMPEHWERLEVTTDAGEKLLRTTEYSGGSSDVLDPVGGPSVGASSFIWDNNQLVSFQRPIESPQFELWMPPGDARWSAMRAQRGTPLASLSGSGRLQAVIRDAYREIPPGEIQYRCLRVVQEDGTKYLVHPVLGVVQKTKTARNKTTITVIRDLIHVHQSN